MKILAFLLPFLLGINSKDSIDEYSYSILFSVTNAGFAVEGQLQLLSAEIEFDPTNLRRSYIYATADPSSIKSGIGIRDKHLRRSDYLDVGRYPEMTLRSKDFKKKGRNTFTGRFDLTIKGVTKEITIPFTLKRNNDLIRYEGGFEINRIDFNVGEESLMLDDTIKITVTALVTDPE